ncbi:hypothetical protein [Manganibacter manganicus]|jgi:hypothetical protein|uniref:AbiJ N-terminal domain-containing protein n=1 Tax=Manganibacter manganicus TaxID=1873176 RepID=A0A1V8RQD5_9HYPH|nr:hypothetical protein [Pseudaminobacter manganicus]OQM75378.1 hypothetical protein BFN67_18230 [Pseudaminobacter manganicus]
MHVDAEQRRKVVEFKNIAVANFSSSNWIELGSLTDRFDLVNDHPRLLRSLSFGDDDYDGCALQVLMAMVEHAPENFGEVERYITSRFGGGGESVSSTVGTGPRIYFQPAVFSVPREAPDSELVSAMMPFSGAFSGVYGAIQEASRNCGLRCERADNIWKESAVIQDIFGLIFRSHVVICDFTGKNPNVFYEAGIAHTLGKHVIPITQSADDIPFDLRHHRYLHYLNNGEGLASLGRQLADRLRYLRRPPGGGTF